MIPVSKPCIGFLEEAQALKAVESGWISSKGEFVPLFEKEFAQICGKNYGVSCNSGSNSLILALMALGVKKGDEVIVPEFTMVATAWAVSYVGAIPVFVDCRDDLNIDPSLILDAITEKTKAIMPVHIYGRKCNMEAIMAIAKKHNLYVIEDCAESHGIKVIGDIGCFSFFGNKIITTGEGGMCVANDEGIAKKIHYYCNMSFDKEHTFLHLEFGFNFRMTNVQAAIGLAQTRRMPELLLKRKRIEDWYNDYLPKEILMPVRDVVWMYDVNFGEKRDFIKKELWNKGIETRVFFKPMSMQPMYSGKYKHLNAYKWSLKGLYLPTYPELTKDQVEYICKNILDLL